MPMQCCCIRCAINGLAHFFSPSARHAALLFLLMHHPLTWGFPVLLLSLPLSGALHRHP